MKECAKKLHLMSCVGIELQIDKFAFVGADAHKFKMPSRLTSIFKRSSNG